jgi:cytochrome c5
VSKQDTHFFNVFSIVLGLLVGFAILVFALSRYVGHAQNASLQKEPLLQQSVAGRVASPARVAVAGQDNSALTIAPVTATGTAAAVAVVLENGEQVYETACKACHNPAVASALGAPPAGDKRAWAPRIAQGKATLYEHAIKGFKSTSAAGMPAKGGRTDLSDDLVKQAVDHLVAL